MNMPTESARYWHQLDKTHQMHVLYVVLRRCVWVTLHFRVWQQLSIIPSLRVSGARPPRSAPPSVRPLYLRWGLPTFPAFFKYCQWVESGSEQGFSYPLTTVNTEMNDQLHIPLLSHELVESRWRNMQVGPPSRDTDWSIDKLKSDWLKSTTHLCRKSSLPGKSQKHTHTTKAIHTREWRFAHSHSRINSYILNIQRFLCTVVFLRIVFCICEIYFTNI